MKLLEKLSGWKTVLGYIAVHIFGAYPLVIGSFQKFLADPSKENAAEFIAQLILAFGVLDRVLKNVKKATAN